MIFFVTSQIERVLKTVEGFGCKWEGMKGEPYFAIYIPTDVKYLDLKGMLDKKLAAGVLDFKESCLAENHKM